ncbi:MAG: DUF6578 domain-containing protein [Streptosporangiaceae bacterium]
MGLTVWVDGWQMQCCGEPFAVGSDISWTLGDADADWLEAVLGAKATEVDSAEEHHGALAGDAPKTAATVSSISAVHCRYAHDPSGDSKILYPVRDSAVLTELPAADGWTPDRGDLQFTGYLVELVSATS